MKRKILILLMLFLGSCLFSCGDNTETPEPERPGERPVRPHTHSYSDWVIVEEANLFSTGIKEKKCNSCDESISEVIYYLDEVRFNSKTYQYSGSEKKLLIDGLLPKGVSVVYKNNTLTSIGTKVATAELINSTGEVIETKTATLKVVDYKGLPKLEINTGNQPILNKTDYVTSTISIDNCEEEYELNGVSAGVRLRGNGSLEAPKKPYRIKFMEKQNLLGLNDNAKVKNWVLLADYYDYSMLRNASAFKLGQSLLDMGGYYSSDCQHVNLYINGIYNGVYLLAEQQQANKNRVNINEPEPTDLSYDIGYLLELDSYALSEGDYINLNLNGLMVKDYTGKSVPLGNMTYSIKSDYYSDVQKKHIEKYLNNVFKIMHNAIINNKYYCFDENYDLIESNFDNAYQAIDNVINLDSLYRTYILHEIMKNTDVGFSSFYVYVDFKEDSKHPKLTFGAPWDFDWSSGNVSGEPYYSYTGHYNDSYFNHSNPWLLTISNADFFNEDIKEYWSLFNASGIMENLIYTIDEISSTYANDFAKNFSKWNVLGTQQHVYATGDVLSFRTQADAKNWLKSWLNNRYTYINSLWS